MNTLFICLGVALLATGCAGNRHAVIAHTGTVLGLQIAENPSTQLYEAKLGFARSEFAYVPSNWKENGPATGRGASDTPDMLMELRYGNLLSRDTSLYQRLAVGSVAVAQPGAAFMFAKGRDGLLDAATADAVSKTFSGAPLMDNSSTAAKAALARQFQSATDKAPFDNAAKKQGYASFSAFLLEPSTKADTISAIANALKAP